MLAALTNLDNLLKGGTYALVAIGFAALWTGSAFGLAVAIPFLVLSGASWFFDAPKPRLARLWTPLTVVFIALAIGLAVFGFLLTIEAGVLFVVYLTTAKLYNRDRLADYLQLLALSFLLLAAGTAFNNDVVFGLFFASYVIVGVVTFAAYHLKLQLEENEERGGRPIRQLFGLGYLGTLVAMALITFLVSVTFFFVFPRLGFGFFVQKHRQGIATTGFSTRVDLGTHGQIKSDNRVVMRVQFPDGALPPADQRFWRGISFDRYDGRAWSRTTPQSQRLVPRAPEWDFAIVDPNLVSAEELEQSVRQEIYLEPINAPVLFGMPEILTVGLLDKNKGPIMWLRRRQIAVTSAGDVEHKSGDSIGFQYVVRSDIDEPPPHALRAADRATRARSLGPTLTQKYLQLPRGLDPKVKALAERVTAGTTNDYDRALAVQRYLIATYAYTTDLPDVGDTPPLEAFLFETKRGHCEFFASAMVIMLRTLGIPARSVNGFRGGQWNDFDDFLAVRNADAHSWVEVHFGPRSWITFDPTPPAADVSGVTAWHGPFSRFYDSLKFKWLKYVIEYDLETQVEFIRQASEALGADPNAVQSGEFGWTLRDLLMDFRKNALAAFLVIVIALLGGISIRVRGRQRPWLDLVLGAAGVSLGAAVIVSLWKPAFTGQALSYGAGLPLFTATWALLAKRGFRRRQRKARVSGLSALYVSLRQSFIDSGLNVAPSDGPEAFIGRVADTVQPVTDDVRHVVDRYMLVRFGGGEIEPREMRELKKKVKAIKRQLARS